MRTAKDLRLAGLLASGVSISVLWAASALLPDVPFGPSAVAEWVIRVTPGDVATFFIELLHHWARRLMTLAAIAAALVAGTVALVVTAGAGAPRPVVAGAILAVLTASASFISPTQDASPPPVVLGVLAATAAYVATASAFARRLAEGAGAADEGRRRVIRTGVGVALGIAAGGAVIGYLARSFRSPNTNVELVAAAEPASIPARDDFPDIPGLSPEITSVADHYVVDINLVQPAVEAEGWTLRVLGEVDEPLELTFSQLQSRFEVVEEYSVLCCVSNEVGGDLIGNSAWGGVRLADVLEAAGARTDGADVVFRAADGYSDSIPIEVANDPSVLVAVSQNGRPLQQEHGFPCRIRVPQIYGMKNVKWLESIELVGTDYRGYWQERGWSDSAVVRTQSRIDVAGEDFSARRGEATWVAGIAWAGERGISRVEVTTDGGSTWIDARLKDPVAANAWTLWAHRWTPPQTGTAEIACRATDGRGETQREAEDDPHPAGATGYHRASVQVS